MAEQFTSEKFECPCCGDFLGRRQIDRHVARLRRDTHSSGPSRHVNVAPDVVMEVPGNGPGMEIIGHEDPIEEAEDSAMDHTLDAISSLELAMQQLATHEPRRNPRVTIEDWPDPLSDNWPGLVGDDPPESDGSDTGDESIHSLDRDPEYTERTAPPGLDPLDEPEFTDEEMRHLLETELGDLADSEWIDMYERHPTPKERNVLRFLATRLRTHFSRSTYEDLRHGVCEELDFPSEFIAWRRLRILSGLQTRAYDCCVNSCCCFLGKYKDMRTCPFCGERRYNHGNRRRRAFYYSPLIPQLRGLFQSREMASNLRYRADTEKQHGPEEEEPAEVEPEVVRDVFDGEHYRELRETRLDPDGEYCFFDKPEDIALGLSTDGFTLFKRRRRGLSTAWPIILINYNLHPRIRTRLENVLCVGVVPGPRQCKDLNSFLIPLLDELLELEKGVESGGLKPDGTGYDFVFHAFIIIIFGDIPAVTKVLLIKGHNALSPCRTCYIQGVLCRLAKSSVYYVPLMRPHARGQDPEAWPHEDLPMRTHELFLATYDALEASPTKTARDQLAREHGINSRPIFAHLRSIDLASCAPYDAMHLLFENLVPNMIRHWTGTFKGLDQGSGSYQLSVQQWEDVGRLTARAARTIPAAFVGTLPDIAQDGVLYKAEAYAFWIQYIAPVVLKGRLPGKYYDHMLLIREIILQCLQLEITTAEIDTLQEMVNRWVTEYEEYYYQYRASRLPTCPLTIHALLHMPFYIKRTGPLWASWAFVMERFCGHLLPAVKNRVRPYEHLDNYIQRRAQMQIVSRTFNLPSLSKPVVRSRTKNGVEMSSHEMTYDEFPETVLGTPVKKHVELTTTLMSRLTAYFGVVYGLGAAALRARIDKNSVVRYGRFRVAGGDHMRTADLISKDPTARDNSFVRYTLFPDRNANFRNRADVPFQQTQYGQLLDIYHVEYIEDNENATRTRYLLAHIKPCDTRGLDAALPHSPFVKYTRMLTPHMVHILTIDAVIGRIALEDGWAIIDRSRSAARTQFVDDAGNELE